ncbi:MAG: hypothetical protein LUG16_01845, partial [Candidatus Gastranaerophilales bacterium]|nr:hypothetical protein [Candidatus Gastranaerophilales bacterium]
AEEAAKRTEAEKIAQQTAEKAQKYYTSLSDVTTGKSAKESAKFFEESFKNNVDDVINSGKSNNVKSNLFKEKIKPFIKQKIVPLTKTKEFKVLAAIAIAVGIITASVKIHNSKNQSGDTFVR